MQISIDFYFFSFQTEWYKHYCFINMGDHWFQLDYDVDQPCNEGMYSIDR